MRINQILPNFSYGDAIGDDTLALHKIFQNLGHTSRIYAGVIHPYLSEKAFHWKHYRQVSNENNILIYHFSVGSEIANYLYEIPDRLVLIYHNITPAHWFYGISPHMTELAAEGINQLKELKNRTEAAWADSEFNAEILRSLGYKNVRVLPIIFDFSRFEVQENRIFEEMYYHSGATWLFVGRVTPNKCHEDIIKAFAFYKNTIDPHARIMLVGDTKNCWRYTQNLLDIVKKIGISDIYFTGMIDDDELVSAFKMADLFICLSEHEGFCVPLLEAMHFELPIIAFRAGAVPSTLDGSGILINDKDPRLISEIAHMLNIDSSFRKSIIMHQLRRLNQIQDHDFSSHVEDLLEELE